MRIFGWFLAMVLLAGAAMAAESGRAASGQGSPTKVEKAKNKPVKPPHRFTSQEEKIARDFARRHHPELLLILDHLEESLPNEYRHAINDLNKTAKRIAQLKDRGSDRYEIELHAWKLRSRIQLLAAQLQLEPENAKLRGALREALLEQADLQIAACEAEQQRQVERLKRLEEQIRRLREERERRIEKQIEALTRPKKRADPQERAVQPPQKSSGATGRSEERDKKSTPKHPAKPQASAGKPDRPTD